MEESGFHWETGDRTSKGDHGTGIIVATGGDEQIDLQQFSSGRGQVVRESEGCATAGLLDRRLGVKSDGMFACSTKSNFAVGLPTAGASKTVAGNSERKGGGQPSFMRPKAFAVGAQNNSSIRTDLSGKTFGLRTDPRDFFSKQAENYRQEIRQQQIQQWVLKHNFVQESLPSDCWPDKYPQITAGNELENPVSAEKLRSSKGAGGEQYQRQESSSTQSLYKDPSKMNFAELKKKQARFVSNDAITVDSGTLYASEDASVKRTKLAESNEEADQGYQAASALCEQPESTSFVGGFVPRDGGNNESITLSQWLSRPGRIVDRFECLHIFKQILEFVDLAHAQGVVLRNVRPSSFILSSMHRVSFLDSASSRSSSGSSEPSTGAASVQASLLDTESLGDATPAPNEGRVVFRATPQSQGLHWAEEQPHTDRHWSRTDLKQTILFAKRMDSFADRVQGSPATKELTLTSQKSGSSGMERLYDNRSTVDVSKGILPSNVTGNLEMQENLTVTSSQLFSSDKFHEGERFPVRPTHLMEETWYASPEEILEGTCSYASDIYSLGVLLFELFCPFNSWEEYSRLMSDLRHRILPPRMLSDRPKEAAFCLWLLHPDPNSRPKSSEVLQSEILHEVGEALAEREAAMNIEEKEAEVELHLDFLQRLQEQKQELASRLQKDLSCLMSDIREVKRRRSLLQHSGTHNEQLEDQDIQSKCTETKDSGSALQPRGLEMLEENSRESLGQRQVDETGVESKEREVNWGINFLRKKEELRSKCARLMSNFHQLEQVYFAMRGKVEPQVFDGISKCSSASAPTGASGAVSDVQKVSDLADTGLQERDSLGCFFDSLCKYARYSRFEVKATLRHGDLLNTANMVCSLGFDRDHEFFATAGVCKRIKVFECDAVLNENVDIHYPVIEMLNRSMLSSICWNSYIKSHIASSDYEGVVQLWDASTGQALMRYAEHEKRAWSVDFSQADPTKLASGSDDGSVKLWNINQEGSIGTIKTNANVCCIQFPKDSAHLIAFGSADYNIYCYDLRNTRLPWCILANHSKAVSYVKFLDSSTLVSASTDNTLKLWDLARTSSSGGVCKTCILTYTGHTNEKNFVGLSVMDGYIACGSETNSVFTYHKSLPMPMASHKFGCVDPISGQDTEDDTGQFVSSVCWRGKSQTLVAANSMGNIKVLEMV